MRSRGHSMCGEVAVARNCFVSLSLSLPPRILLPPPPSLRRFGSHIYDRFHIYLSSISITYLSSMSMISIFHIYLSKISIFHIDRSRTSIMSMGTYISQLSFQDIHHVQMRFIMSARIYKDIYHVGSDLSFKDIYHV
jgi:hypothetical protein